MDIVSVVYHATKLITDKLSDEELATMNICAQLEDDPRDKLGYEKAKPLFTENNRTKMHLETKNALAQIVLERFSK